MVKLNKESYCKFAYQLMLKKRSLAVKFHSQELEKVHQLLAAELLKMGKECFVHMSHSFGVR